jgi:hypothetical protein
VAEAGALVPEGGGARVARTAQRESVALRCEAYGARAATEPWPTHADLGVAAPPPPAALRPPPSSAATRVPNAGAITRGGAGAARLVPRRPGVHPPAGRLALRDKESAPAPRTGGGCCTPWPPRPPRWRAASGERRARDRDEAQLTALIARILDPNEPRDPATPRPRDPATPRPRDPALLLIYTRRNDQPIYDLRLGPESTDSAALSMARLLPNFPVTRKPGSFESPTLSITRFNYISRNFRSLRKRTLKLNVDGSLKPLKLISTLINVPWASSVF